MREREKKEEEEKKRKRKKTRRRKRRKRDQNEMTLKVFALFTRARPILVSFLYKLLNRGSGLLVCGTYLYSTQSKAIVFWTE